MSVGHGAVGAVFTYKIIWIPGNQSGGHQNVKFIENTGLKSNSVEHTDSLNISNPIQLAFSGIYAYFSPHLPFLTLKSSPHEKKLA